MSSVVILKRQPRVVLVKQAGRVVKLIKQVSPGVPTGGTTGQVLAKRTAANYDTEWVNQTGGGGGGSLTVQEIDGTPSVTATTIQVPNGTLTNPSSGVARLGYAGTAISNTFALTQTFGDGITISGGNIDATGSTIEAAEFVGNHVGDGSGLTGLTVSQVSGAAPLDSPALTGTPTAPTAAGGTNTTQLATTAFVQTAVSGAVPKASFVTLATNAGLDNERVLTAGTALTLVDGGAGGLVTLSVSLGTLGTQACAGNDSRLSDSRTPTGAAGGDLTGTYPNPTLNAGLTALTDVTIASPARGDMFRRGASEWENRADPSTAPGLSIVGRNYTNRDLDFLRPERQALDFGVGLFAAVTANSSGTASGNAYVTTARGLGRYASTGTTSTGTTSLRIGQTAATFQPGGSLYARAVLGGWVTASVQSSGTDEYRVLWGFHDEWPFGTFGANGVFFIYDRATYGDHNWRCVTRASSTSTVTDSGVAAVGGTAAHLAIDTTDLTAIRFWVNGTLVATHTTNIPAAPLQVPVALSIRKTAGTTDRFVTLASPSLFMEF